MKSLVKLNDHIEEWKAHLKIQELSKICGEVIWKSDDGIHLNGIKNITKALGWKEEQKILKAVKTSWKHHNIEHQFYDVVEKN